MKLFNSKDSSKTLPEYNDQNIKNKWKWGWGWYVPAAIVGIGINNYYKDYGDNQAILYLTGIASSILIYLYLKNKVFHRIEVSWKSTLYSGIIAWILPQAVVGLLAVFIPNVTTVLIKNINKETNLAQSTISECLKEDAILWEFFIDEPNSDNEFKNNIKIIDKSIPLYQKKDSVVLNAYENIYSLLIAAQKKNPKLNEQFPLSAYFMKVLIDEYRQFAYKTTHNFTSLKNYYNAVLFKHTNADELYNIYAKTEEELQTLTQSIMLKTKKLQTMEK